MWKNCAEHFCLLVHKMRKISNIDLGGRGCAWSKSSFPTTFGFDCSWTLLWAIHQTVHRTSLFLFNSSHKWLTEKDLILTIILTLYKTLSLSAKPAIFIASGFWFCNSVLISLFGSARKLRGVGSVKTLINWCFFVQLLDLALSPRFLLFALKHWRYEISWDVHTRY